MVAILYETNHGHTIRKQWTEHPGVRLTPQITTID